jgi:hypothetical protein
VSLITLICPIPITRIRGALSPLPIGVLGFRNNLHIHHVIKKQRRESLHSETDLRKVLAQIKKKMISRDT